MPWLARATRRPILPYNACMRVKPYLAALLACVGAFLVLSCSAEGELRLKHQFVMACHDGDSGLVAEYLDQGLDANGEMGLKGLPLFLALRNGHFEIAEVLLDHGADVNARFKDGSSLLDEFIGSVNITKDAEIEARSQAAIDWLHENGARRPPE